MRKALILVALGIVALTFVACSTDYGGETTDDKQSGSLTDSQKFGLTPTAISVLLEGEVFQMIGTEDYKIVPDTLDWKVGEPYQLQYLNENPLKGYRLICGLWNIRLFAAAGKDSEVSKVIVPTKVEEVPCYDEFNGMRGMQLTIRVTE